MKEPSAESTRQEAYDRVLRKIADEHAGSNVPLIEGFSIVTDFSILSADLPHPSEFGHVRMGEPLAEALRPIVAGL